MIKHSKQSSLQKAHNARIGGNFSYQPMMSETVFSLLKNGESKNHVRKRGTSITGDAEEVYCV